MDEFLNSDKTICKIGKDDYVKIRYNENIDFIYKPSWGDLEYGNELKFCGLYEKITQKLYGDSYYFNSEHNKERYSKYYVSSTDIIGPKLVECANKYLNTYIEENKLELMNIGRKTFDEYISDDNNYQRIKTDCIHHYIYQDNVYNINFSVDTYERYEKDLLLQFIQNPVDVAKKVFNKFINNTDKEEKVYYNDKYHDVSLKEYIGFRLLQSEFVNTLLKEVENNPSIEDKKKYEIINSIKDLDAQMITITIKHNEQLETFKYPKRLLYDFDLYEWHIPDLKVRDKIENLYKGVTNKDNVFISDIVKIEYSRKVIYEDKELLNNKNNMLEETHDITDEMFD